MQAHVLKLDVKQKGLFVCRELLVVNFSVLSTPFKNKFNCCS